MMPDSCSPLFNKSCCSEATKPRKILPAPQCTHTGCLAVCFCTAATSYCGSSTPACTNASLLSVIPFNVTSMYTSKKILNLNTADPRTGGSAINFRLEAYASIGAVMELILSG